MVVFPQPPRIDIDHAFERRQPVLHLENLVHLLLVTGNEEAGLGVLEHIGHLLADGILVERHRNRTHHLGGDHRPVEIGPVAPHHRHPVAFLEAEGEIAVGQGGDLLERLLPCPFLPDAELLFPIGRPIGKAFGIAHHETRNGVEPRLDDLHVHIVLPACRPIGRLRSLAIHGSCRCGTI